MRGERGNVLFFILIGIALFAGLSFAVTQSSRSGSGIERERASLLASEFIQYGTAMEQAVANMVIVKGVPDYGIDVVDASTRNTTTNGSCTKDACKLFHPKGGGIQGRLMPDQAYDPAFSTGWNAANRGKASPRRVAVQDVGSSLRDLGVAWFGLKKEICQEINRKLGISNWQSIPTESNIDFAYTGTYTSFPEGGGLVTSAQVDGKRAFCIYFNASWGYVYYQTLWAR